MASTRTFLQLQNESLADDFDALKYREQVKVWINQAVGKVARRVALIRPLQGTATINTVAGQASYTLPTDDARPLSVREPSLARPLEPVSIGDIDERQSASSSRGSPEVYALYAGALVFFPVPDKVYVLEQRYERDSTTLVADGDTLPLPDPYADLPITFTRARLFEAEDDAEMATYWQSRFDRELAELRSDVGRENRGRRRQLPSMWDQPAPAPRFQRP
jgi:hypothetical protein